MTENKARDDKFINKDQKYEPDFILGQYNLADHPEIIKAIEQGNYQTHDELYKALAAKGIKKKS